LFQEGKSFRTSSADIICASTVLVVQKDAAGVRGWLGADDRIFVAVCAGVAPVVNVTAVWIALANGAQEIHRFGVRFLEIATPVNVIVLIAVGWFMRRSWLLVVGSLLADAAASFLLFAASGVVWLMLHAGDFS